MLVLGIILILIAVIVVAYVVFATGSADAMPVDWGIFTATLTPVQIFMLGAATVLVLSIGSVLLASGLRRKGAQHAEVKKLRRQVSETDDRHASHPGDDRTDRPVDEHSDRRRQDAKEPRPHASRPAADSTKDDHALVTDPKTGRIVSRGTPGVSDDERDQRP